MVPMLTCGLVRSNFAFATVVLLWTVVLVRRCLGAELSGAGLGPGQLVLLAGGLRDAAGSTPGQLCSSGRKRPCDAHCPVAFAMLLAPGQLRSSGRKRPCDAHCPVAFAMISF